MSTSSDGTAPFLRTRAGKVVTALLLLAALLLLLDHWAHFIEALPRYLFLIPLLVCIGMHFLMHGGHRGRGSHGGGSDHDSPNGP